VAGTFDRFRSAQNEGETYARALAELRLGSKRSHWMWFVFPQLAGLGQSTMSRTYAIASLLEARSYLADPVLGARLRECAAALLEQDHADAERILGPIDALKLRSSMTLFSRADPGEAMFRQVLERYFADEGDPVTESLLAAGGS
jgi:uncharacterized protein (DUF1810 family)